VRRNSKLGGKTRALGFWTPYLGAAPKHGDAPCLGTKAMEQSVHSGEARQNGRLIHLAKTQIFDLERPCITGIHRGAEELFDRQLAAARQTTRSGARSLHRPDRHVTDLHKADVLAGSPDPLPDIAFRIAISDIDDHVGATSLHEIQRIANIVNKGDLGTEGRFEGHSNPSARAIGDTWRNRFGIARCVVVPAVKFPFAGRAIDRSAPQRMNNIDAAEDGLPLSFPGRRIQQREWAGRDA